LLRWRLLLPLGGLVLGRALREGGDGWISPLAVGGDGK
jgi:hypothetical protein